MWEGVPQCRSVCPSMGRCALGWEGMSQCVRVFLCVGRCALVKERVPQCGRVCPRLCEGVPQ